MALFVITYGVGAVMLIAGAIIALKTTYIVHRKGRYVVRRLGSWPKQMIMLAFSVVFAAASLPLVIPVMGYMDGCGVSAGWSLTFMAIITNVPMILYGIFMYKLLGLVGKRKSAVLQRTCRVLNAR